MMLAEPLQITYIVTQTLESLGIRYFVGGSLASSFHGIPRATQDADLVAEITERHIPELVNALQTAFYIEAEMIRKAIHQQRSFNVIHLETMFKIDVFILKPDAVSQEEMARCQRYHVSENPDTMLFVTTAEDTIIHKLVWFQLGGLVSERQWTDVRGVLQVQQHDLDYAYLERVAEQRNVLQLLQQAIAEIRENAG